MNRSAELEEEEKIEVVDVDKSIQDNLEVIGLILTPLQKWLFKVFLSEKTPYATRALYDKLILDTYKEYAMHQVVFSVPLRDYLPARREGLLPSNLGIDTKKAKKNYDEFVAATQKRAKYEVIKWVFADMKKRYPSIIPPNIKQITSDLETLKRRGLITRMKVEGKKADSYWILNPSFYIKYKDEIPRLIKMP